MGHQVVAGALQNVELRTTSDRLYLGMFTVLRNHGVMQQIQTAAQRLDALGQQLGRHDYSLLKVSLRLFAADLADTIVTFPSADTAEKNYSRYYRPLVTVLRLHQAGFLHGGHLEHSEYGEQNGLVLRGYQFPPWQIDRRYVIDDEVVAGLRDLVALIDPAKLEITTALDMFEESYTLWRAEARLVQLIACFEAALGSPRHDAGSYLAEKAAGVIGGSNECQQRLSNLISMSYKARNAIVHNRTDRSRWKISHFFDDEKIGRQEYSIDVSQVEEAVRQLLRVQLKGLHKMV